MNQVKTFFLMVILTVILVGLGSFIGGKNGAMLAFAVALAMNFVSYWFSDRIVLAMYGAKPNRCAGGPPRKPLRRTPRNSAPATSAPVPPPCGDAFTAALRQSSRAASSAGDAVAEGRQRSMAAAGARAGGERPERPLRARV